MFQKWQGAEFSWMQCPLVGDRCTGPGDSAVNVILRTGLYLTGERGAIGSVVDWGSGVSFVSSGGGAGGLWSQGAFRQEVTGRNLGRGW